MERICCKINDKGEWECVKEVYELKRVETLSKEEVDKIKKRFDDWDSFWEKFDELFEEFSKLMRSFDELMNFRRKIKIIIE